MTKGFPTVRGTYFSGNKGVNIVSKIVNDELCWIFRPNNNETDFGIDAYADVVLDGGGVTGQSFALQIKAGPSYFKTETANGYKYYGDPKHLNYYANMQCPVIIVICNIDDEKCYWVTFDINKIELTEKSWTLNIPKGNLFGRLSKDKLLTYLPVIQDFTEDVRYNSDLDSLLKNTDLILYTIDRQDIEHSNISNIKNFFERLQRTDDLARAMQGRVEINIHGYDDDIRELFEIKDVKRWFRKANKKIKPWFFFLNTEPPSHSFIVFWENNVDVKAVCNTPRSSAIQLVKEQTPFSRNWPKLKIEFSKELHENFFDQNWRRLNEMTDRLGMTMDENKEISLKIIEVLNSLQHDI